MDFDEMLINCKNCRINGHKDSSHPQVQKPFDPSMIVSGGKKKRVTPIQSETLPNSIMKIPISVSAESPYDTGLQIVEKIKPSWGKHGEVKMKTFSGGISNKLVGFYLDDNKDDIVIVKVYGEKTEEFIDREKEIKTMEFLHANNFGSKLYAIFNNGIAYEYLPGEILTVESCRDPHIFPIVAKTMAALHSIPVDVSTPDMWRLLYDFQDMSKLACEEHPQVAKRLLNVGYTPEWALEQIQHMKALVGHEVGIPLGFCHNDILLGNIIHDKTREKISFIDFEYGAVNYVPFDIANHLNEFAGVDDCDYSRFPDRDFIRNWVQQYLEWFKDSRGGQYSVTQLMKWIDLFVPLSHLLWTVWASIQACYSSIDFDFVGYCNLRVPEYNKSVKVYEEGSNLSNGINEIH